MITRDPATPNQVECGICGSFPVGEGCYHQCPNSIYYYSPEQEREDDAFYGDDDVRERYMEQHCPRHGAYAGDCGGCESEHIERESDIPVSAEDFMPATVPSDDDLPF